MDATAPTPQQPVQPATRWALITLAAVVVGALVGLLASWGRTSGFDTLTFTTFALCTAPVGGSLTWLLTDHTPQDEHAEESVEHAWLQRALAGAALDLIILLGLTSAVTSVLDVRSPGATTFLVALMADTAIRMAWLRRREG